MLTAEQTIATRRKYGGGRFPFVEAHDQHDLAKVNSTIGSVKIFFRLHGHRPRMIDAEILSRRGARLEWHRFNADDPVFAALFEECIQT